MSGMCLYLLNRWKEIKKYLAEIEERRPGRPQANANPLCFFLNLEKGDPSEALIATKLQVCT
jgi:hypothetical protein